MTLSGSATIVSQQQLRLQHRTAAAYTTNYSALSHSFRDPGQSFRVPPAATSSSSPAAASQQQQQQQQFSKQSYLQQQQHHQQPSPTALGGGGQSFLPSPAELALPGAPRPSSSSGRGSRPPTAGGPTTSATTDLPSSSSFARTTLPPLSSVVPQSLAAPGGPTVLPALQSGGGVRRPTTAPRPGTAPATYLSSQHSFVSVEDLDWHLSQSFQYPTLDVVVSPTTQSSWEEEHTQRMTPPEAVGAGDASGSTHRHPPMDPGSATTHRFHSTHPRSPTQPQSLGSVHLDLTAVTAAAATMMHSDVLGGRCSPTTAHAFRSGRRPSHEHRLRILSKFTMYIDNEIEISDMQK